MWIEAPIGLFCRDWGVCSISSTCGFPRLLKGCRSIYLHWTAFLRCSLCMWTRLRLWRWIQWSRSERRWIRRSRSLLLPLGRTSSFCPIFLSCSVLLVLVRAKTNIPSPKIILTSSLVVVSVQQLLSARESKEKKVDKSKSQIRTGMCDLHQARAHTKENEGEQERWHEQQKGRSKRGAAHHASCWRGGVRTLFLARACPVISPAADLDSVASVIFRDLLVADMDWARNHGCASDRCVARWQAWNRRGGGGSKSVSLGQTPNHFHTPIVSPSIVVLEWNPILQIVAGNRDGLWRT